ncbi:MAG TPA: DUF433 domain-containing protein, partial [Sphingomonadaceae bacterium]|nr:DUF433 domain-containing protein [Sphingomonadaceae bacterium]
MRTEAEKLKKRDSDSIGKIERHRFRMRNAWVVGGTRIPVSAVMSFTEAGYSVKQIIEEYPDLTARDIRAARAWHRELTRVA